ncbi:signal transduction histidine kinase [Naematelia encephala]|uniref:Signal transduction histidine kinase n=1 Tax=Naematelia encephala TaxID=71784 RepID=A0A1Y2BFW7_9TREE|nr:signal transduction histidine kinase [Naematelia encephala]
MPDKATPAKPDKKAEEKKYEEALPSKPNIIDVEVFNQIRDMDGDDEDEGAEGGGHEFSKGIVWGFFEQAESTFEQMEEAIAAKDLPKLSGLGHFLKGSSAALGIIRVQASCEKMQHYGHLRDEEAGEPLKADEALKRIKELLEKCKADYEDAKKWMEELYEEDA